MAFEREREFVRLAARAQAIVESPASWAVKYELVFGPDVRGRAIRLGFDPVVTPGSDECKVRGYVEDLEAYAADLKVALDAIDAIGVG